MLEESRKRLEESFAALSKLTERNNANKMGPMDGISGIVVNVKSLLKWCEDCICSVDCQCNSCVYGCIRSVDCQCYYCLDDCSNKKNDGDNQTGMVSEQHAMTALLKVENSRETDLEYNVHQVFDECPQWVGYEIIVGFQSIQNTNTAETEIMNSHLNSRLLVVEDTIPKLMSLNDLPSAYNVTTHLESAPFSIKVLDFLFKGTRHKLNIELGDKRIDINMERDILTALCGPHAIICSPSHALGSYICNWVDTGQAFWVCLYRLKSSVYAVSRVLLFSYFNGFSLGRFGKVVIARSLGTAVQVAVKLHILLSNIKGSASMKGRAPKVSHLIIELQFTFDPGGILIGPEKRINFMKRFCCWNDSREVLTILYQVIIELSREVHSCQQKMDFPTMIAIREWKNAFIWDTHCRSYLLEDITAENPHLCALGEHFLKFPFDPGGSSSAF